MMIRDGGEGSSGGRWESKRAAAETDGAMEFARRPYVGLHWWACASSLLLFHHGHGETKWTRLKKKKNLSTKKRLKFLKKKRLKNESIALITENMLYETVKKTEKAETPRVPTANNLPLPPPPITSISYIQANQKQCHPKTQYAPFLTL